MDGPLLLTATNALPAEVTAEIARLKAKDVYILGATSAVGTSVESALKASLGATHVTRLAGDSRYTTARKVADEVIALATPGYDGVAYVATGGNFPDALGVSPIATAKVRPILLADPRSGAVSLPAAVNEVYILGSTKAVGTSVQTALETALGADAGHLARTRDTDGAPEQRGQHRQRVHHRRIVGGERRRRCGCTLGRRALKTRTAPHSRRA